MRAIALVFVAVVAPNLPTQLIARGVSEQPPAPGLNVAIMIKGDDYNSWVRPTPTSGHIPKPHAEGTLIIDLVKPNREHTRVARRVPRHRAGRFKAASEADARGHHTDPQVPAAASLE